MKISFCCFFKSVISLSWFWKWFNSLLLINFWVFATLAIWLMLVSIFMKMLSCFSMNVNIFFLSSSKILFSTDAMIKLVRVIFLSLQIFFQLSFRFFWILMRIRSSFPSFLIFSFYFLVVAFLWQIRFLPICVSLNLSISVVHCGHCI